MMVLLFFALLMVLGIPIALSIGLASTLFYHFEAGRSFGVVVQAMFAGINSFALMAIPFFIFAGDIMLKGGVSRRLIAFARQLVGWTKAGLPITGVVSSMFFAALSGSAPATVAAIGGIMIPSMQDANYTKRFAVGLLCAAGALGIVIPPSITLVVYGVVAEQSITALFWGGILPGIFIGLVLVVMAAWYARTQPYERDPYPKLLDIWRTFRSSLWGLLMPAMVLGGIYFGIFTPTEASAVAVAYSLFVSLFIYREMDLRTLMSTARRSVIISAVIMFIIGNAQILSRYMTFRRIPTQIAEFLLQYAGTEFALLLVVNIVFLFFGMIMSPSAAVIILTPLFLPSILAAGVNPIHFGVLMVVNLSIGMITPPFGLNLYVAAGIGDMNVGNVVRAVFPFMIAMILSLLVITYYPPLTLWLIGG